MCVCVFVHQCPHHLFTTDTVLIYYRHPLGSSDGGWNNVDLGIRRRWAARWYKNTCLAGTKVQILTQEALLGHPKPYRPGFRDFHEKENRPKPTRIAPELFGGDGVSMAACGLGFTCAAT